MCSYLLTCVDGCALKSWYHSCSLSQGKTYLNLHYWEREGKKPMHQKDIRTFICASPPDYIEETQLWVLFGAVKHQMKCICTGLYLVLFILKRVVWFMYLYVNYGRNKPTFMIRVGSSLEWSCVKNCLGLPITAKYWHSFIFCLWCYDGISIRVGAVKLAALSLQM